MKIDSSVDEFYSEAERGAQDLFERENLEE